MKDGESNLKSTLLVLIMIWNEMCSWCYYIFKNRGASVGFFCVIIHITEWAQFIYLRFWLIFSKIASVAVGFYKEMHITRAWSRWLFLYSASAGRKNDVRRPQADRPPTYLYLRFTYLYLRLTTLYLRFHKLLHCIINILNNGIF